jgi:Outer membrane protein beta-barrel domain
MRRAWPLLLLLLCLPRPAAAQTLEITGGYSLARDSRDQVTLPAGWMAGAAIGLTPAFSLVADVSGQYKTVALFTGDAKLRVHTVMGGVRAAARVGQLTEFGQVLIGVVRTSGSAFGETTSGQSLGVQPGIGVDYPRATRWAARAQFDVRLIQRQADATNGGLQYRFVVGLVRRFELR